MKVDIICPVFGRKEMFENLYNSFKDQKGVEITQVICPLTASDEDDEIIKFFEENNIIYFHFPKEEFSHFKTREKAIREYAKEKCIIMMSEDIKLENEYSLYNLANPVDEDKAAYAYGRQIAKKKCIEKYIRERNYPGYSKLIRPCDVDKLQIMAFFASDAFSCINRDIFIKLGGYQGFDYKMNEDQIYSYIVLSGGYNKMYCSDAVVEHYHTYTLKQLYSRYYEAGKFYKGTQVLNKYKMTGSGMTLAKYVFRRSLAEFDIVSLIKFLPNMSARYLGMKKGRK